jgi:hypothetical protein
VFGLLIVYGAFLRGRRTQPKRQSRPHRNDSNRHRLIELDGEDEIRVGLGVCVHATELKGERWRRTPSVRICKRGAARRHSLHQKVPHFVNSLCILLQELYLMWRLDSNSLSPSDAGNRCGRALALCNEIRGQQRARPAKTSLTVNGDRPLCCALLGNEAHELVGLLKRRRATVGNWQTKK